MGGKATLTRRYAIRTPVAKLFERQTTKDNHKVSKQTAFCLGVFISLETVRQCLYQTVIKQMLNIDKILSLVGYLFLLLLIIIQRVLYKRKHEIRYYNFAEKALQWIFIIMYCGIISIRLINFIPNYLSDAGRYDRFDFIDLGISLAPNIVISDLIFVRWLEKCIIPVWYTANIGFLIIRYHPTNFISLLIEVIIYGLYMIIAFYVKENFQWEGFLQRTNLHQWNKIHEEILEEIPENIAVLNFEGGILYQNQYFRRLKMVIANKASPGDILSSITNIKKRRNFMSLKSRLCSQEDYEELLQNIRSESEKPVVNLGEDTLSNAGTFENLREVINYMKEGYSDNTISAQNCIILDGKYYKNDSQKPLSMEIKISLFEEIDGTCSRLILILKDTTERDMLAALESTTKFKDNILDSFSHEIRTPINAVKAVLEASSVDEDLPESIQQKYILPAMRSAEMLYNIVNDIFDYLQFSRSGLTIHCQNTNVVRLLESCYEIMRTNIEEKKIRFVFNVASNVSHLIRTDADRLRQVVINLLSNAIRYTHEGEIVFSLEKEGNYLCIKISDTGRGMDEDAKLRLTHLLSDVYKGEKVTQNSAGIGLGLMISHIIASLLGPEGEGGLCFESELGGGSIFSFLVENKEMESSEVRLNKSHVSSKHGLRLSNVSSPKRKSTTESIKLNQLNIPSGLHKLSQWDLMSRPEEEIGSESQRGIYYSGVGTNISQCVPSRGLHSCLVSAETVQSTSKKSLIKCQCPDVMIVDDEPMNILAFKLLIKRYKRKVDSALSGEAALQIINSRKTNPCCDLCRDHKLIFMDLNMPGMDGFETTKNMRNKYQIAKEDTAIVACTAYMEELYKKRSLESGMDDFVNKPLTQMKVIEVLEKFNCL